MQDSRLIMRFRSASLRPFFESSSLRASDPAVALRGCSCKKLIELSSRGPKGRGDLGFSMTLSMPRLLHFVRNDKH